MASITIERGLNQQSLTQTSPLIGFNYQQGIQFLFERGTNTGTYAEVNWNGTSFRAVKIAENIATNTDRYQIDMTEIVKATKSIAPFEVTVTGLVQTINYTINGLSSAGAILASSAAQTVYLTFAKTFLKSGLYDLYTYGTSRVIYHCGKIGYLNPDTPIYVIKSTTRNGVYAFGDYEIDLIYRSTEGEEIAWLNRDGAWSFWNFRKISEIHEAKKSTEIANYALSNYELATKTYDLETELKIQVMFDTLAVDATHYRYLTEIGSSERVIYSGKVYRVKDYSKQSTECKQNLRFNLTLEIEENA